MSLPGITTKGGWRSLDIFTRPKSQGIFIGPFKNRRGDSAREGVKAAVEILDREVTG
jgi:hypothetical protein